MPATVLALLLPLLAASTAPVPPPPPAGAAPAPTPARPPRPRKPRTPARTLDGGAAVILAAQIDGARLPANPSHANDFRCVIDGSKSACRKVHPSKFTMTASQITCSESDVAVGSFHCDVRQSTPDGKEQTRSVDGHAAFEMQAALRAADVETEGAAGHVMTAAKAVTCTIDTQQLLQRAGGGAHCDLTAVSGVEQNVEPTD